MKTLLALIALMVVITSSPQPGRAQAKPKAPQYLSQFPSVERVKAEIKGTDPIDTAARQQQAFWLLNQMIPDLAGQRFDNDEMTREEEELRSKYGEAFQWYQYKERAPSPQDQPRQNKLLEFYEKDPGFLDELLKRFFSPEFRAGYYRTTKKQPPGASQNARVNPSSGGAAAADAGLGFPAEPTAVLTVTNGFRDPANKLNGMPVLLLNDSFRLLLQAKKLLDGPPGATVKVTPLRAWAGSCLSSSPVCQGVLNEVQGNLVGYTKIEATGRATFGAVPPGSYFVLALTVYNQQALAWDLRVELKPGANSISLDPGNTVSIDSRVTQTMAKSIRQPEAGATTATSAHVPAAAARPIGPKNSVLNFAATSESRQPVRRTTFYLLDDDFESILRRAGFTPQMLLGKRLPLLSSFELVKRWTAMKETNPAFSFLEGLSGQSALPADVEQRYAIGVRALSEHTVATVTTNAVGRASFPGVPAGTYYVYATANEFVKTGATGTLTGNTVTLNDTGYQQATIWNLKVAVKPGQNSVTLTPDNAYFAGN